jgi:Cu-Zn family superoxide dismutase
MVRAVLPALLAPPVPRQSNELALKTSARTIRMTVLAVAVFATRSVHGEVTFEPVSGRIRVIAEFTRLPAGQHGFHIHRAGDLRGEGCKGACAHYHVGAAQDHGGPPGSKGPRHTGDLGNVEMRGEKTRYSWWIQTRVEDLWGRSIIVHADPDDLGQGDAADSKTTGHSGKRIACAVIGRTMECD